MVRQHSCSCINIVVIATAVAIFYGLIFSADVAADDSRRAYLAENGRAVPLPGRPGLVPVSDLAAFRVCKGCFGEYTIVKGPQCACDDGAYVVLLLLRPSEDSDDVDRILWPGGDRRRINMSALLGTNYVQVHYRRDRGAFIQAAGAYITAAKN